MNWRARSPSRCKHHRVPRFELSSRPLRTSMNGRIKRLRSGLRRCFPRIERRFTVQRQLGGSAWINCGANALTSIDGSSSWRPLPRGDGLKTKPKVPDADMSKAGRALERAAVRARQLAEQTGTPLYIFKDG